MNEMQACEMLVRRLEQIAATADRTKRRPILKTLERVGAAADQQKLREMLGTMAAGMSEALGDIIERIERLDAILVALDPAQAPAQGARPAAAAIGGAPREARVRSSQARPRKLRIRHRRFNPPVRRGR
jgi:hypothetical protein